MKYSTVTGEKTFYDDSNSPLRGNKINAIAVDEKGNKWIGTEKNLIEYNNNGWIVYNTSNSGIPGNLIFSILPAGKYIWFGTNNGVARFDGKVWNIYNSSNSDLKNNSVYKLASDRQGNLFAGTYGGLYKYNGKIWNKIYDDEVDALAVDTIGNAWVGTIHKGLTVTNGKTDTLYNPNNSTVSTGVMDVYIDKSNIVWVGTQAGGLSKFDGSKWTHYISTNSSIPSDYVDNIVVDNNNLLWFGAMWRVIRFDGSNWQTISADNSNFVGGYAYQMALDTSGTAWFNFNGVTSFDGTKWRNINSSNSEVPWSTVNAIFSDRRGNLWVSAGTESGRFNGTKWYHVDNFPSANVYLPDGKGNILLISSNQLYKFNGNSTVPLSARSVSRIAVDSNGYYWAWTDSGLVKFDGANTKLFGISDLQLPSTEIKDMEIDKFNNIWFITNVYVYDPPYNSYSYNALSKFDGKTSTIYSGFPNSINQIRPVAGNSMWITAPGYGLIEFDGENKIIYTPDNSGLISTDIKTFGIDKNNNKWIGQSKCLSIFNENGVVFNTPNLPDDDSTSTDTTKSDSTSQDTTASDAVLIPKELYLSQNYPNPFNPSTVIKYQLPVAGRVELTVYDILGNEVAVLVDKYQNAGSYQIVFNTQQTQTCLPDRQATNLFQAAFIFMDFVREISRSLKRCCI